MRRHTVPALLAATAVGLAACSGTDSDDTSTQETPAEAATSVQGEESMQEDEAATDPSGGATESQPSFDTRDVVDDAPDSDWQDALDAAKDEFDGDPSKIELESAEGGGLEYKVELISADTEYAVQFDADSLDKLWDEEEDLGDDAAEEQRETFDPTDLIDLDDAVSTARDEQDGAITSWKVEGKDDGTVQYEFDILPDGASDDVEVQIDAQDGSIIHDS